jgi:hypothetical protein
MSSEDNRAVSRANFDGALINLMIPMGEPNAVSQLHSSEVSMFHPTGFPSCTADLRAQSVRCTGLVKAARYTLRRSRGGAVLRATSDDNGAVVFRGFPGGISGGDALRLTNSASRALTMLHVAHLRVDITGNRTVITSGRCEAGDYYGPPLTSLPPGAAVGANRVTGEIQICPVSGRAGGLPTAHIEQTDDLSGGLTRTQVPFLTATAPSAYATLYGDFTALAQTGLTGTHGSTYARRTPVALTITRAGSRRPLFHAADVNTPGGVPVHGLGPGVYTANWVIIDANGDTRTVTTKFIEA